MQCSRQSGISFAQETQVHGECISGLQHALNVVRARRASGSEGASCRPGASTQHGGNSAGQSFFYLLRCYKVNVRINATCSDDHAFAADDLCAGANDDIDTRLRVGVTCFANGGNAIAFEANVGLHNAPVVNNQGIGEHAIHGAFCVGALRLRHAIANGFAATELHFFAVAAGL